MTLTAEVATRAIRRGRAITVFALLLLAGLYLLALAFTPTERFQGLAQKIFYIHPPAAYAMQLAFFAVGIASILYLLLRDPRLDAFAVASAEVGMVLGMIVVITGPIWGKPVWGAWWTWDARLTFTTIELLVFAGYFALRSAVREPDERAKFAAVTGIMGMLLVPFNHLTVYLFNTTHPQPVMVQTARPDLPWAMARTFIAGFVVFTVCYLGLVMQRYGITIRQMLAEDHDAS